MVSLPDGGFAIGGNHDGPVLHKINADGATTLQVHLDLGLAREDYVTPRGLNKLADGGFVMVGRKTLADQQGQYPCAIKLDGNGNVIWMKDFSDEWEQPMGGAELQEVIVQDNDVMVAAGSIYNLNQEQRRLDALLVRLRPDNLIPQIFYRLPEDSLQTVLIGDTIQFIVRARDRDGNEMDYRWLFNGGELDDYDTTSTVRFEEAGVDTVSCRISIDAFTVSTGWIITATDFLISAYTPDTLALSVRRGSSLDFSIDTMRYIGEVEPGFLWTLTNLNNGNSEVFGEDSSVTIPFPRSGNYTVEGRAYRWESSDTITWNVSVIGNILAYVPEADSIEVLPDSVVHFEIVPSAPEDESLTIQWFVDGEIVREGEVALDWAFGEADSSADLNRRYQVQCVVADSVEADAVAWVVTVQPLSTPRDPTVSPPRLTALLEVSPNPFNSTLSIRYLQSPHAIAGGAGGVSLSIYDIAGREVYSAVNPPRLTASSVSIGVAAGQHSHPATEDGATTHQTLVWNASTVPAGVYFVRLQNRREAVTKKVVLMR